MGEKPTSLFVKESTVILVDIHNGPQNYRLTVQHGN